MQKDQLIEAGHLLVRELDETAVRPRAALWVQRPCDKGWTLQLVPAAGQTCKKEFERAVKAAISRCREKFPDLDQSRIETVAEDDAAIDCLRHFFKIKGLGRACLSNSVAMGRCLPDGILLRIDL